MKKAATEHMGGHIEKEVALMKNMENHEALTQASNMPLGITHNKIKAKDFSLLFPFRYSLHFVTLVPQQTLTKHTNTVTQPLSSIILPSR